MTATQIVQKSEQVAQQVTRYAKSIVSRMPDDVQAVLVTLFAQNPVLTACDHVSIAQTLIAIYQLGLNPHPRAGEVYLVPFRDSKTNTMRAQYLMGYKGLLKLAYRSGKLLSITADVVREGDILEYAKGTEEYLKHVPLFRSDVITHIYAVALIPGPGDKPLSQIAVMSYADALKLREQMTTRKGTEGFSCWRSDETWLEMVKKTLIRRLLKYLPTDPRTQIAIAYDEALESGVDNIPQIDPTVITIEEKNNETASN